MSNSTQPTYVNDKFNYDGQILRDITLGLLKFLNGRMYWDNQFETGIQRVNVPFFYAGKPDERFFLDAFVDDVPGIRPEGDYPQAPRVMVHLQEFDIKSKELTNPNVWVRFNKKVDSQLKAFMGKMQPIPIKCKYELKVQVQSEIELFKYFQRFMDIIWYYHFYHFEHKFFKLDAVIDATDSLQKAFENMSTMESKNEIEIIHTLDIHTYYPHTRMDKLIPANKRVNFKNYLWDLTGSNIIKPKHDYDFLKPPTVQGDQKKLVTGFLNRDVMNTNNITPERIPVNNISALEAKDALLQSKITQLTEIISQIQITDQAGIDSLQAQISYLNSIITILSASKLITDTDIISALIDGDNWSIDGNWVGTSIISLEGNFYSDDDYFFIFTNTTTPIRILKG